MKRFLTLLLVICLLPVFPALGDSPVHPSGFLLPVYRQTEVPEGYTGLYTYEDIQKIVDNPAGKFMLMDDITFPAMTENPLRMVGFTGVLDGNGYGFRNVNTTVYINPRDTYYVGLFGWVRDGEICNLYVDGKILLADSFHNECRSYTGSIAGRVWGASTIFNCVTKVKISFENPMADFLFGYHGGVVGYLNCNAGATISYCHNLGQIYATENVGGIVGYVELEKKTELENPSVFACLNDGDIETHSGNVGGIAGMVLNNTDSKLAIASCVNNGSVYSPFYNGGIIGKADGVQIKDCLNTGTVMTKDSPYTFVGGIVHSGNAAVINCVNTGTLIGSRRSVVYSPNIESSQGNYCLDTVIKNISKGENAQSATGILNADQMCVKESFPLLDFTLSWALETGMTNPYPKALLNLQDLTTKFEELKKMFPSGKYWNHVGVSYADYSADRAKYNATCTDYPCDASTSLPGKHNHGSCSPSYETGECGCNTYDGSIQCAGFARYIGNYLMGTSTRNWSNIHTYSSIDKLKEVLQPGDYIRFGTDSNGHSSIVVSVDENGVSLVECNYVKMNTGKNCEITWTRHLPWSSIANRFSDKNNNGYILRYQQ